VGTGDGTGALGAGGLDAGLRITSTFGDPGGFREFTA
jgi:hypothetical protein